MNTANESSWARKERRRTCRDLKLEPRLGPIRPAHAICPNVLFIFTVPPAPSERPVLDSSFRGHTAVSEAGMAEVWGVGGLWSQGMAGSLIHQQCLG